MVSARRKFIVDRLEDFWKSEKSRFPKIKTLVINQDNDPENNSRRTQFMKRIVEFSQKFCQPYIFLTGASFSSCSIAQY